ncbi:MAG: hypothetical protein HY203_11795 [Nitrospirae bacterium]|nr:hypothetical protein [Nitrospirota bacterium]
MGRFRFVIHEHPSPSKILPINGWQFRSIILRTAPKIRMLTPARRVCIIEGHDDAKKGRPSPVDMERAVAR